MKVTSSKIRQEEEAMGWLLLFFFNLKIVGTKSCMGYINFRSTVHNDLTF